MCMKCITIKTFCCGWNHIFYSFGTSIQCTPHLFFFIFTGVCLVLASHHGNGWKSWNWGSLSKMLYSLWQKEKEKKIVLMGKNWKVVTVTVQFHVYFFLLLDDCWVMSPLSLLNRLVVKRNLELKQKLQKSKPKASEGRKHLSDFGIIQQNIVYVIGFSLNLTDEDVNGFISLYIPFMQACNLVEHGAYFIFFFICCYIFVFSYM